MSRLITRATGHDPNPTPAQSSPPSKAPPLATRTAGTTRSLSPSTTASGSIAVDAFEGLAVAAARTESWAECLRLLAAAERLRDETGYRWRFACEHRAVERAPDGCPRSSQRRCRCCPNGGTHARLARSRRLRTPRSRRAETAPPRLGQPHPDRAAGRRTRRRGAHQPPDRRTPPHGPSDRQDTPRAHLHQARRPHPRRTRRRSGEEERPHRFHPRPTCVSGQIPNSANPAGGPWRRARTAPGFGARCPPAHSPGDGREGRGVAPWTSRIGRSEPSRSG